jgi:O-methyltransferase
MRPINWRLVSWKITSEFRRFFRERPTRNNIAHRDEVYRPLFDRGLALDGTADGGRRLRFWSMIQLYKSTCELPGATAEAGCLRGLSSFLICHYSRILDPAFTGTDHYLIDSFRGLDIPQTADLGPKSHPIVHELSRRGVRSATSFRHRTERTLAEFSDVSYHEGWIPEVLTTLPEREYRFVHIDVDLHDATRDCLEYFYPRMVEFGVIVIDDYGFQAWPGCKIATDDWSTKHRIPVVALPTGNAFIIKRT